MAAAIPKTSMRWHEQDTPSSLEQSTLKPTYARPAVTTGASLPWGTPSSQSLGQPRAFHAGALPISTITLASQSQAAIEAPALQKSGAAEGTVPASPFAEIIAPEMKAGPFSLALKEGFRLSSQDLDPAHAKQGSLQSASSHFTVEAPFQLSAGHLITTAQDAQGLATSSAICNAGSGACVLSSQKSFPSSPPPRHQNTVITTAQQSFVPGPATHAATEEDKSHDAPQPMQDLHSGAPPPVGVLKAEECQQRAVSPDSGLQDADGAVDDSLSNHVEQRRLRRRNNNRESAKRVREKRDADLKVVCEKVARLEEYQAQLLKHCMTLDNDCHQARQKLQKLQSRWEDSEAENMRLKLEVEHLRKNVRVGEQGVMEVKDSEDLLATDAPDFKLGANLSNFEWDKTLAQLAEASPEDWCWI